MAKITNVTILNQTTLQLNQDASKGDTIDLLSLNKVDISSLSLAIANATDKEYERRLLEQKSKFELEKHKEIQDAIEKMKEENLRLAQTLENTKENVAKELALSFEKERSVLNAQLQTLKQEKESLEKSKTIEIENALNKQERALQSKIQELEQRIAVANLEKENAVNLSVASKDKELLAYTNELNEKKNEIANLKQMSERDKTIAVQEKEKELSKTIRELEDNIANLELNKSSLNIKKIGERLEEWCNNEYQLHALHGFENCTWEKDNKAVREVDDLKGTKADYLFKVYASPSMLDSELLTSVTCEMKSEDPTSTHKKKNSDHFKKLDSDRVKKNCEYALLISELEWESTNDSPIRKVFEYDKMYVVRPQYFIVFLSIVTALGQKYKDILLEVNRERLQFKDSEDILNEFEDMKNNILDYSLKGLDREVNEILDQADKIHGMSKKIMDSAQNIIDKRLDLIKRKIEGFNINKINRSIDKL